MFTAWLVLISLANPAEPPKLVRGFSSVEACYAPANSADNQGIMPLYRTAAPKGYAYVCMKIIYSS
jgi:hypothetical protein